jgi:hypothetical protein
MECPLFEDLNLEEKKSPQKIPIERENIDIKTTGQKSGKKARYLAPVK